ncbi:hypothetical protein KCM76_07550 [Zooshikella marina]|uniref:Mor transcription activator domain-containing protein n=1 Tax=Zooshikella ganghwensis TaxID=202772 RepID=A0A4P9VSE2_9GAMM|nr:Mor transcription activator family protein [Zooshikella ganghwensis]MBU2705832.1 hypothetical protein [Zooshikella ganghwensis]RDH46555.1 hypothetical protein B9G39_25570 [Zooshikella ganghwensis]
MNTQTLYETELPGFLKNAANIIGLDATLTLAQRLGGARVYIPHDARPDHPLSLAIGHESAKLLCEHFSGETVELPRKSIFIRSRNALIKKYHGDGYSIDRLALTFGITRRHVYNILFENYKKH